jgi:hypothetical protein
LAHRATHASILMILLTFSSTVNQLAVSNSVQRGLQALGTPASRFLIPNSGVLAPSESVKKTSSEHYLREEIATRRTRFARSFTGFAGARGSHGDVRRPSAPPSFGTGRGQYQILHQCRCVRPMKEQDRYPRRGASAAAFGQIVQINSDPSCPTIQGIGEIRANCLRFSWRSPGTKRTTITVAKRRLAATAVRQMTQKHEFGTRVIRLRFHGRRQYSCAKVPTHQQQKGEARSWAYSRKTLRR